MSSARLASDDLGNPDSPSTCAQIFGSLLIVSPHFDDAVFSCGSLLSAMPGCTVVTVCTALPDDASVLTDWDKRCGFSSAHEAMQHRSRENSQALDLLGAKAVNLAFLDGQYLASPRTSMDLLADTLLATIAEFQPVSVLSPLGLFHADIPYCKSAQRVQERLARLADRGIHGEPVSLVLNSAGKALAVEAYRSQFRGLGHTDGKPVLQHTEQYWRMHHDWELL